MAISSVAIANLALGAAHCRATISAIGEQTAEGQTIALHYEPALEDLLRAAHWNFARKQVNLSLLKDATATPPGSVPQPWLFEYAYPSDCLLARAVMPQLNNPLGTPMQAGLNPRLRGARFVVAQDNDTTGNPVPVILANVPQAQIIYTCTVSNTNLFDAEFVTAFWKLLASRICRPLTGDKGLAQALFQEANATVLQAAARNGDEGLTIIDTVPDWIRVRGFLDDWAQGPGSGWYVDPFPLSLVI